MDNLSSTLPYLFLVTAFPFFKANNRIDHSFMIFKNRPTYLAIVIVVDALLLLGVGATLSSAIIAGSYGELFLEFLGPILFGVIGYVLFKLYLRRMKQVPVKATID